MNERKCKWYTENRDNFRAFLASLEKMVDEDIKGMEQSGQDLSGIPDNYSRNPDHDKDYRDFDQGENYAFVAGKHVTILDKDSLSNAEAPARVKRAASKKEKRKKILTPSQKKEAKEMKKRKSYNNNNTRWMPDSSLYTYLGKPPFHAYGKGNTNPACGGLN